MKNIFIVLIAFLAAACSSAPVNETTTEIAVTGPQATWQMVFPKGHWELSRSRVMYNGATNYALYGDSKTRRTLTIMITKSPVCGTAKDCREYWWKHRSVDFRNPYGVDLYERNGFAGVSFVINAFKKMDIGQVNYVSESVHDGYWIDIRLAKIMPTAKDMRQMNEFIDTVSFSDSTPRAE